MRITSSLPQPSAVLRKMTIWVCRQIGVSSRKMRVRFARSRAHGGYTGRCYTHGRLSVRIGKAIAYPMESNRFGQSCVCQDDWDTIVLILAHEVAHYGDHRDGTSSNERSAEWQSVKVLSVWQQERYMLLAQWLIEAVAKCKKATRTAPQDRRAEKATKMLTAWQRKAKLAATKIKKYKRQVAYYEKVLAARRA